MDKIWCLLLGEQGSTIAAWVQAAFTILAVFLAGLINLIYIWGKQRANTKAYAAIMCREMKFIGERAAYLSELYASAAKRSQEAVVITPEILIAEHAPEFFMLEKLGIDAGLSGEVTRQIYQVIDSMDILSRKIDVIRSSKKCWTSEVLVGTYLNYGSALELRSDSLILAFTASLCMDTLMRRAGRKIPRKERLKINELRVRINALREDVS